MLGSRKQVEFIADTQQHRFEQAITLALANTWWNPGDEEWCSFLAGAWREYGRLEVKAGNRKRKALWKAKQAIARAQE